MAEKDTAAAVSLDGLAAEWEGCVHLRRVFQQTGTILECLPGKKSPSETVAGVGRCAAAMEPLVKRLLVRDILGNDVLGMASIPQIEEQLLDKASKMSCWG